MPSTDVLQFLHKLFSGIQGPVASHTTVWCTFPGVVPKLSASTSWPEPVGLLDGATRWCASHSCSVTLSIPC